MGLLYTSPMGLLYWAGPNGLTHFINPGTFKKKQLKLGQANGFEKATQNPPYGLKALYLHAAAQQ